MSDRDQKRPASPIPSEGPSSGAGGALTDADLGSEPAARSAPLPVLLLALLVGLVYWGSMYILEFGGEADARVHYPYMSFKQIDELQPKSGDEIQKMKGGLVYARVCSPCHMNDGNGSAAANAPPLAGSEWVLAKDPSRIIRIVLHGLTGPITVGPKEYGQGTMLAWKDTLSDEDIANVLTFVRNSWGNKAPPVKPEQAKTIRNETAGHSGNMTAAELLQVNLKQ